MAHPVLFGLLGAFIVSRVVMRRRFRHAHGGGGCGRQFRGGPIDLGAPDDERGGRFGRRFGRRWQRWQRDAAAAQSARAPMIKAPPVDVVGSLELNQRQRELFDEVVAKAKTQLGAGALADALAVVGQEPLERDALEILVGKGDLADDLEHLHFSLTPEQRARLRAVASA